ALALSPAASGRRVHRARLVGAAYPRGRLRGAPPAAVRAAERHPHRVSGARAIGHSEAGSAPAGGLRWGDVAGSTAVAAERVIPSDWLRARFLLHLGEEIPRRQQRVP